MKFLIANKCKELKINFKKLNLFVYYWNYCCCWQFISYL